MNGITIFGKLYDMIKSAQANLFNFQKPKTKPKLDLNLYDPKATEGTEKDFGQGDKRRLERTKSGKNRWVDADNEYNLFSAPKEDVKQPEPVESPKPEPVTDEAPIQNETIETEETLDEMVKRLLDEKQGGKEFKDVNERVAGSKKEMAAIKKLSASELLKQDSVTQYQTITREKVLNPFDPIAHKETGESPGLVFIKLKLRQALTTKPENNDLARKLYVEEMPKTLQAIEDAKSYDEIIKIAHSKFHVASHWEGHGKISRTANYKQSIIDTEGLNLYQKAQIPTAGMVYGARFFNILFQLSDSGKAAWEEAKKKDAVTEESIKDDYKNYWIENAAAEIVRKKNVNALGDIDVKHSLARYNGVIPQLLNIYNRHINEEGLFEGSFDINEKHKSEYDKYYKENHLRNPTKKDSYAVSKLIKSIWEKMTPEERKSFIEKGRDYLLKMVERSYEPMPFDEWKRSKFAEPLRDADWSYLKTDTEGTPKDGESSDGEKPSKDVKADLRIHHNPPLQHIIRRGGEEVTDEEIKTDSIINDLGFKSVQYGNYVKDIEAKEHVKNFIGAIKDLGAALNLDIKKLNELGGISLAFGARGSGSAVAHYEPMRKIINITKSKGDGSVAHEWAHYIDHVIGGAIAGLEKEKGLLTVDLDKMQNAKKYSDKVEAMTRQASFSRVERAAFNIMGMIRDQGGRTIEKTVQPPEEELGYYISQIKAAYNGGTVYDIYNRRIQLNTPEERFNYSKEYIDKRVRNDEKVKAYKYLAKLEGKPISFDLHVQQTEYYNEAENMGKYWVKPQELFARAFESYMQDKLESKGMFNNYLVSGNKINGEDPKMIPEFLKKTYPQGEERLNINVAFDELIDAIREQYQNKEQAVKSIRMRPFLFRFSLQKSPQMNLFGEMQETDVKPAKAPRPPKPKPIPTGTKRTFPDGTVKTLLYGKDGKSRRWFEGKPDDHDQIEAFPDHPDVVKQKEVEQAYYEKKKKKKDFAGSFKPGAVVTQPTQPTIKSRWLELRKAVRFKFDQQNLFGMKPETKKNNPTVYDPDFTAQTPSTGSEKEFKNGDRRKLMYVGNGRVRRWVDVQDEDKYLQYNLFEDEKKEVPAPKETPKPQPKPVDEIPDFRPKKDKPAVEQLNLFGQQEESAPKTKAPEVKAEEQPKEPNIEEVLKLEPGDNEDRFFGTKVLVKDKYSKQPFEAYLSRILSVAGGGFTYEISRENPMDGSDPARFRYDADQIKEIVELKDRNKEKSAKEDKALEDRNHKPTTEPIKAEPESKPNNELIHKYAEKAGEVIFNDDLEAYKARHDGRSPSDEEIEKARETVKARGIQQFSNLSSYIVNKDYNKLLSILSSISNKYSRNFFQDVTGINLPKTQGELSRVLVDFTGHDLEAARATEEKERKNREEERKKADRLNALTKKKHKDEDGVVRTAKELIEHHIDSKGKFPVHVPDMKGQGSRKYKYVLHEPNSNMVTSLTKDEYDYAVEYYKSKQRDKVPQSTLDSIHQNLSKQAVYHAEFESATPDADDKPQNPFDEVEAEDMKPYIHPVKRRTTPLVDDIITFKYNGRERTGSFRGKSGGGWVVYDKTTGGQDIVDTEKVENLTIKNNPHDKNFGDPEYIKYAHESGNYDEWIRDGRMTRKQVNEILQSAGIEPVQKSVNTKPSQAQIEAGNYKKEHIRLYGMEISVENPKGSTRSGKDSNGEKWSVTMKNDYGYIRGTEDNDKDHVDVFLGDDEDSENVYIVNQIDPNTGEFDEHKCMLRFKDKDSAIAAYKSNYNDSSTVNRIGSVKEMSVDEFKGWVYKPKNTNKVAKSIQITEPTPRRNRLVFRGRKANA